MTPESFIGSIDEFAGSYAPRGWMNCDGRQLSTAQYQALFSILGTAYGGNGITTFALPDQRPFADDKQSDTGHHRRVDWTELGLPRKCICVDGIYPSRD